jgi:hypothetical protein
LFLFARRGASEWRAAGWSESKSKSNAQQIREDLRRGVEDCVDF